MTIAQDFKDDPLEFMEDNIILIRYGSLIGAIKTLTLTPLTNTTQAYNKKGLRVPIYQLVNGINSTLNNQLRAYWCPYDDNQTLGVMLGNQATLMFTAEMSGCSLGLGSANPDGSRMVFHSNVRGTPNQQDSQETELAKEGVSYKMLKPNVYRNPGLGTGAIQISPFGIRQKAKWKLYYQVHCYQAFGGALRINHGGVKPVLGVNAY